MQVSQIWCWDIGSMDARQRWLAETAAAACASLAHIDTIYHGLSTGASAQAVQAFLDGAETALFVSVGTGSTNVTATSEPPGGDGGCTTVNFANTAAREIDADTLRSSVAIAVLGNDPRSSISRLLQHACIPILASLPPSATGGPVLELAQQLGRALRDDQRKRGSGQDDLGHIASPHDEVCCAC